MVTTITKDGGVVFKEFNLGSRRVAYSYKGKCSLEAYCNLCCCIEDCIANADREDSYVDDCSEELKVYHLFGRVQIMYRGLGNENVNIANIMYEFF